MGLVALGSAKGSPGVSTALAALGATWPAGRRLLLAELDPAGGDVAGRFEMPVEPGLVSLAAAGRRELSPPVVLQHTQAMPGAAGEDVEHRAVLVGPPAADQAHAALVALRGRLAPVLAAMGDVDVVADCGRLDPGSPALGLLAQADVVVVMVRPVVAEVHHLRARLAALALEQVEVVVVGERPYPLTEVAEAVGARPLAALPHDPRAAAALAGAHPDGLRVLRRSRLLRAARALADDLAGRLVPVPASGPATMPEPGPGQMPGPGHQSEPERHPGPRRHPESLAGAPTTPGAGPSGPPSSRPPASGPARSWSVPPARERR